MGLGEWNNALFIRNNVIVNHGDLIMADLQFRVR